MTISPDPIPSPPPGAPDDAVLPAVDAAASSGPVTFGRTSTPDVTGADVIAPLTEPAPESTPEPPAEHPRGNVLRLELADTGEVWEWAWSGVDDGEPWERTALDLALAMVPSLVDALDRRHVAGDDVSVTVEPTP